MHNCTSSILLPSGEDANPLHKRLPAEVITRKPRAQVARQEEKVTDEVRVDLKTAIYLKPDARPKWLSKAFKLSETDSLVATELYNIITSRKFLVGLPQKICRRLRDIVYENCSLFSDKQQRHLKSDEWQLNVRMFSERGGDDLDGELIPIPKDDLQDELPEVHDEKEKDSDRDRDDRDRDRGEREKEKDDKKDKNKEKERERERERDRERARSSKVPDPREARSSKVLDPREETWVAMPASRGQEDRMLRREAEKAEERAKRKARERDDQERWMEVAAEASRKKVQDQHDAKRRKVEDEVDNSLMLLESMGTPAAPAPQTRSSRVESSSGRDRRRGGLSRSRSIKVRSRSRRRRRSRSRRRRRRSESAPRGGKVDFADALRRRLQEREANDTTRMAVVDPGHAQRWSSR